MVYIGKGKCNNDRSQLVGAFPSAPAMHTAQHTSLARLRGPEPIVSQACIVASAAIHSPRALACGCHCKKKAVSVGGLGQETAIDKVYHALKRMHGILLAEWAACTLSGC